MRYLVSRVLEGREKDKTKKGGGEREKERKGKSGGGDQQARHTGRERVQ